jgi:hypothetical protein
VNSIRLEPGTIGETQITPPHGPLKTSTTTTRPDQPGSETRSRELAWHACAYGTSSVAGLSVHANSKVAVPPAGSATRWGTTAGNRYAPPVARCACVVSGRPAALSRVTDG